ncbi:hypothetical protein HJC23_002229 [Cyclotella cryptica]|uniref:Uncharacterized protein n=1 Tax=Cyclotella cryptica TaxID=29204 RepID=A0ABD3P4X7_9STRA|eukprot:CCRYP_017861-RA/>CCRYP_017861-RA protein AED:0.00 eAED:0.00 QI:139/-1/1/1/-1/1/1/234/721
MASSGTSPLSMIHNDTSSPSAAAIGPCLTQNHVSEGHERPAAATKTRVLLRVKRRRRRPNCSLHDGDPSSLAAVAATPDDTNPSCGPTAAHDGGEPVKKRKVDNAEAPEIIRLALPLPNPKRRKSCEEKEQLDLIHRLSSAVSLYGDDTTAHVGGIPQSTLLHTPSRNRKDTADDENRTPPEGRAVSVQNSTRDEQPVPPRSKTPVKPKRSVIFRKMTDLRKVLLPETSADQAVPRHDDVLWNSKGEERSKWLRVVDVKLQDSDEDDDNEGMGPRLQRMRPRPTGNDGHGDNVNDCGEKSAKRRKLGLVVERSCTVLESEFLSTAASDAGVVTESVVEKADYLEGEVARLIDYSLTALHNQGGGSVHPFLSFLKMDSRLGFVSGIARGSRMINYKFRGLEDHDGRGRTVLHYAAIWGDTLGIQAALEMGADPTVADASGYTPSALAKLHCHQDALSDLLEAEASFKKREDDDEYYYEVYCLEEENKGITETSANVRSAPTQVKVVSRNENNSPYASSFTTSESEAMDSPPGLIRMDGHCMSEDEDDSCALMELRNGFGYWNEQGELILEAGAEQQSSAASSIDFRADDGRESSEEDASIDYPDEQSCEEEEEDDEIREKNSHGFDFGDLGSDYDEYLDADAREHACNESDEDSDAGWRADFRNRFVARNGAGSIQDDIDSEGELSSGGFGTVSQRRLHGWEYSGGMSDGESEDEYAGPMLG